MHDPCAWQQVDRQLSKRALFTSIQKSSKHLILHLLLVLFFDARLHPDNSTCSMPEWNYHEPTQASQPALTTKHDPRASFQTVHRLPMSISDVLLSTTYDRLRHLYFGKHGIRSPQAGRCWERPADEMCIARRPFSSCKDLSRQSSTSTCYTWITSSLAKNDIIRFWFWISILLPYAISWLVCGCRVFVIFSNVA